MDINYRYPGIFNDVIGPVMRGPSSSHCAASLRIGRMARDLMNGDIKDILIQFAPKSSVAQTHRTQGSDMGLMGGILGWEATDERLTDYEKAIAEAGINVKIEIKDFHAGHAHYLAHPNAYHLTLKNAVETHQMIALSTGGGMIEVKEIDGVNVSMAGDYYETLIYVEDDEEAILEYVKKNITAHHIRLCKGKQTAFIEIKARQFPAEEILSRLGSTFNLPPVKKLNPVLPVLSGKDMNVPFLTCREMLAYNRGKGLDLWQLAVFYESTGGNIPAGEVLAKMKDIVRIMKKSIGAGIGGTRYKDRILGYQSGFFKKQMDDKRLLDGGMLNRMILYTTALMEVKSSMGVIVACPTAGSCAALPGACFGAADAMGLSEDEISEAMLAAGMIGIFISSQATFAAEVGGCQAECGAASGMTAAALVTLAKGDTGQAVAAASLALQNIFGMVCDPVANRVEVPCLGKNIMAAANALACANMALAGFDAVVPLDEVIQAMDKVGRSIPLELRCTALGGLSVTKTSKKIEEKLKKNFGSSK